MSKVWILFRREMTSFFYSPIAYSVMVGVLLMNGFSCVLLVRLLNDEPTNISVFYAFFNSFFAWLTLVVMVPLITMKLFAEEKKTGTYESLMTTPLDNGHYVLAKFFAGYAFYLLLWAPTAVYFLLIKAFAASPLDFAPVYGGFIGLALIGMLAISIGCFGSSLTANQITAAITTFALFGAMVLLSFLPITPWATGKIKDMFNYFSMISHMDELVLGMLDWRHVIFYVTTSIFFLFLTYKVVESRQWKS
ncbi:MAG: ABC transporter permease [Verrucomicrobiae bacterium]|nr:ABC transporter permease [Verrucomicrobiae bacterium]